MMGPYPLTVELVDNSYAVMVRSEYAFAWRTYRWEPTTTDRRATYLEHLPFLVSRDRAFVEFAR